VNEDLGLTAETGGATEVRRLYARPGGWMASTRALLWLVFMVFPLSASLQSGASVPARVAIVTAAAAFVAIFVALVLLKQALSRWQAVSVVGVLMAIAFTLTVADRDSWATLFVYTSGAAATLTGRPLSYYLVGLAVGLCALALVVAGASAGGLVGYVTPTVGVGMVMLVLADLRDSNIALQRARLELARLAVTEERERFARDLHDLLGHSLSVIALKAELAGRLLPAGADDAAREVAELEQARARR
jgi:two-component system sensor histidine kinase DesK